MNASAIYALLRDWFCGLQTRERMLIGCLVGLLGIVFLWLGVFYPLEEAKKRNAALYHASRIEFAWMNEHAVQARATNARAVKVIPDDSSLLAVATKEGKVYKLTVSHAEPHEDGRLHVSMERVAFRDLLLWLESMQRDYGVETSSITVSRLPQASGYVNVTMQLYIKR